MDVFLETTSSIRTAAGTLTNIQWQQVVVWIQEHRPTAAKIELNVVASGSLRRRPSIMTDTAGLNLLFADLPGSIFFRESQERDDFSGIGREARPVFHGNLAGSFSLLQHMAVHYFQADLVLDEEQPYATTHGALQTEAKTTGVGIEILVVRCSLSSFQAVLDLYLINIARIETQSLARQHWHTHKAGNPTDSCETIFHRRGIVPPWWYGVNQPCFPDGPVNVGW